MEPKFESLIKLFQTPAVAEKLMPLSPADAIVYLKEQHQLDFTVEELEDVALGIKAALQDDSSDELSSEQLEEVTGGGQGSAAYTTGYYIGKTVKVVGTVAGIAGFAIAAGLISW